MRRLRGPGLLAALCLGLALVLPGLPRAQQGLDLGQVQSAVLTVDVERLFSASLFGQRVAADLRAASEALAAENRRIEAALTEEERSLTARRATMDPALFRAEADGFDAKVQGIRDAQDAKERALQLDLTTARDEFLQVASPILAQIMQDAGAAVILDRRAVFLSSGAVDVTDQALTAIDAAIGDGAGLTPPAP
jgi:Skp family chaperone for outer membrane proteins